MQIIEYLLDAHLKLDQCDKLFSEAAGRALSSLIGRYNVYKNFDPNSFTYLLNSCVSQCYMEVKHMALIIML